MMKKLRYLFFLILCVSFFTAPMKAEASELEEIPEVFVISMQEESAEITVDYTKERIYIENAPNNRIYFSAVKTETTIPTAWNYIYVDDDGKGFIDLSTTITNKATYVAVATDITHSEYNVITIQPSPKAVNKSDLSTYSIVLNDSLTNTAYSGNQLEYRIGTRGTYQDVEEDMSQIIENTKATGAVMYVRIKATETTPKSNEVKITLSKYAIGTAATVNTSKLTAVVKKGQQYRVNYTGKSESEEWIDVAANTTLDLTTLGTNTGGSIDTAYTLETRTAATAKRAASKANSITIQAQPAAPTIGNDSESNIIFYSASVKGVIKYYLKTGTVSKNMYDVNNTYEFTVVTSGTELDLTTAKWTSIKSTGTLISNFNTDATVFVRSKAVKANTKAATGVIYAGKTSYYKTSDYLESLDSEYLKELMLSSKVVYTTAEELTYLDEALEEIPTKVLDALKANEVTFKYVSGFSDRSVLGLCKSQMSVLGTDITSITYEILIKKNQPDMKDTIAHEIGHAFDYIQGLKVNDKYAEYKTLSQMDEFTTLYNDNKGSYAGNAYETSTVKEFFATIIKDYTYHRDRVTGELLSFIERYVVD